MSYAVEVRRATPDELTAILQLTYAAYLRKGLVKPQTNRMYLLYSNLDGIPETVPIVAVNAGRLIGTMAVTFDGPRGLPTDNEYPGETADLRQQGRSLACVWRLAVDDSYASYFHVSLELMQYVAKMLVDEYDEPTILIECHPRHGKFYAKKMGFKVLGHRDNTPGLTNAPSDLLVGGTGTYSQLCQ